MKRYKADALFEVQFDTCGSNYLLIYGKHINGYYCCIPNFGVSCEMAEPTDTFYNYERLCAVGIDKQAAKDIAQMIKQVGAKVSPNEDEKQLNIKSKYGITDSEIAAVLDQIDFKKIKGGVEVLAVQELILLGDI